VRDLFLLDPDLVFLNHGSFGACPAEVFECYQRWQRLLERNPVEFLGRRSAVLLREARSTLAVYLGARVDDLVFVPNATTAVNVIARSLDLQPGDEVLATDHEYGACDATWLRACADRGAVYRRAEIPLPFERDRFVEQVMAAAGPRTRLIFASHITSTTALAFPVTALCAAARERGIPTLIDGAHAPGQVPLDLDVIGADAYTGNAHKWLSAPKGAAFLHVRPALHERLRATVTSWGDAETSPAQDGYLGTSVLERRLQWQGTRDIAAFLAVPAAIDFQRRHDWPTVRARCHMMAVELMHRVCARTGLAPIADDADFAQMVPLPVDCADGESLRQRLFERHRIEVPVTRHRGRHFVRVSVQGYNCLLDLDRLTAALEAEAA